MRKVKVAATQMALTWNLKENIEKAHQKVKEAASMGANIILLQELFQAPYFCQKEKYEYFDLAIENIYESDMYKGFVALAKEEHVVLPISFFE